MFEPYKMLVWGIIMKKKYLLIIPLICVCTIFCFLLYWKNKPGKSELIVKICENFYYFSAGN